MSQKPSIPKGTRDFSPQQVAKRNYIFDVIKKNFQRFGFQPIETPSFENSSTLMGKYGEEGDRLIFKILNSGDFYEKTKQDIRKKVYLDLLLDNQFFVNYFNLLNDNGYLENYNTIYEAQIGLHKSNLKRKIDDLLNDRLIEFKYDSNKLIPEDISDFYSKIRYKGIEEILDTANFIATQLKFVDTSKEILINSHKNRLHTRLISERFTDFYNYYSSEISEKALRYDLTVPFARYVVQHQNEISFPFKRYQIQPVWRADRPQKGRFREFYQCDADVVGSKSLLQEVEFVQLYDAVFSDLKLDGTTIKINNRKILSGIAKMIGAQDKLIDFTVALDKLDKIGEEKVKEEMLSKGISHNGIDKLQPLFNLSGTFQDQIESLRAILSNSEDGKQGIDELEKINSIISKLGLKSTTLQLDVTLARGLNYYTGAIFEISAPKEVKIGSIGGGGRYDDLTGIFGLKDVSGVGISFGLDRIYLVLEELNLFPETIANTVDALFINFGEVEALYCLKAIKTLRDNSINTEIYPDAIKMKSKCNMLIEEVLPMSY